MRIGIDASRAFGEQRTGTENYSYELITRLVQLPEAREDEWILYTRNSPPAAAYPSLESREGKGVSYKRIGLPYLWTQVGLAARTWVDRLDVLWVPAHTLPVMRRAGLRTVVTIHGIEYEWLPEYENWLQRWYLPLSTQYAVHSASKIIAVSEFTKRQLGERLGADPKKITVVHEGATSPRPSPKSWRGGSAAVGGEVLRKYGLEAKKYILFVGTVQPRKNLGRLIEAFLGLKIENCKLVICGKLGWGYEGLPIDKYDNVKFLKYVSNEGRDVLLGNALVYVQPSITEGFGLPVLEAFVAGVPVVSSSGGALAEVVGEAGVLFDPFSVEDIKSKIAKVIRDKRLQQELVKKGKKRVKEFTWEKTTKETYSLLVNS